MSVHLLPASRGPDSLRTRENRYKFASPVPCVASSSAALHKSQFARASLPLRAPNGSTASAGPMLAVLMNYFPPRPSLPVARGLAGVLAISASSLSLLSEMLGMRAAVHAHCGQLMIAPLGPENVTLQRRNEKQRTVYLRSAAAFAGVQPHLCTPETGRP